MKHLILLIFLFVSIASFSQVHYISRQRYVSFELLRNDTLVKSGDDEMMVEINEFNNSVILYSTKQMYEHGYYSYFYYDTVIQVKPGIFELQMKNTEIVKAVWTDSTFAIFLPKNELLIFKDPIDNGN